MGNKSTKQKNELLTNQAQRSQGIQDQLVGYGKEDRGYNTGTRDFVTDQYKNLLSGIDSGEGGYGGGGGGYSPTPISGIELGFADPRMNESMEGYRDFAKTGGFSDAQAQDYRSRGTSALPSFYEGLKNQLSAQNTMAGGNVGFNAQMAKLAREKAYGTQRMATDTEAGLQDMIRSNKFRGLEGVGRNDTEFMDRGTSVEDKRNNELLRRHAEQVAEQQRQDSARASAASARNSGYENAFRDKMSILNEMRQLRGEQGTDLGYYGMAGNFGNQATQNIGARETEPGFFDRLGGIVNGVAGAAAGSFLPGGGGRKKPPTDYGNLRSDYGDY